MHPDQDADIPNQSVVHAVRGGRWSARLVKGLATPLSKVCLDTVGEEPEAEGAAAGAAGGGMWTDDGPFSHPVILYENK